MADNRAITPDEAFAQYLTHAAALLTSAINPLLCQNMNAKKTVKLQTADICEALKAADDQLSQEESWDMLEIIPQVYAAAGWQVVQYAKRDDDSSYNYFIFKPA